MMAIRLNCGGDSIELWRNKEVAIEETRLALAAWEPAPAARKAR
jgi:hypothetical protein